MPYRTLLAIAALALLCVDAVSLSDRFATSYDRKGRSQLGSLSATQDVPSERHSVDVDIYPSANPVSNECTGCAGLCVFLIADLCISLIPVWQ